mmetsp:Transcript_12169/g.40029  ORF Transcript_12169/g.40029 Transcript_12169/m.40029 type:complete len:1058 (+) Transcript_12169:49-3222(+)
MDFGFETPSVDPASSIALRATAAAQMSSVSTLARITGNPSTFATVIFNLEPDEASFRKASSARKYNQHTQSLVFEGSRDPEWNHNFELNGVKPHKHVAVVLYDALSMESLGHVIMPLSELLDSDNPDEGSSVVVEFNLTAWSADAHDAVVVGVITLQLILDNYVHGRGHDGERYCRVRGQVMRAKINNMHLDESEPVALTKQMQLKRLESIKSSKTIAGPHQKKMGQMVDDMMFESDLTVFTPSSLFIYSWDMASAVLVLYVLVTVPISICFPGAGLDESLWGINAFVDVFFLLDILIAFNTAIANEATGVVLITRQDIARHYVFRGNFWQDVLASIPWTFLMSGGGFSLFKTLRALRIGKLMRLLRMRKARKIFLMLSEFGFKMSWLQLCSTVLQILVFTHLAGCCWFSIGEAFEGWTYHTLIPIGDAEDGVMVPMHEAPFKYQYLWSASWALELVLPGLNFVDIEAATSREAFFGIVACIVASIMLAQVFSNAIVSVLTVARTDQDAESAMASAVDFGLFFMLRPKLQKTVNRAVMAKLGNVTSTLSGYPRYRDLYSGLPLHIRRTVAIEVMMANYGSFTLFSNFHMDFQRQYVDEAITMRGNLTHKQQALLAKGTVDEVFGDVGREATLDLIQYVLPMLTVVSAEPGEMIIKEGQVVRSLYFLKSGKLILSFNSHRRQIAKKSGEAQSVNSILEQAKLMELKVDEYSKMIPHVGFESGLTDKQLRDLGSPGMPLAKFNVSVALDADITQLFQLEWSEFITAFPEESVQTRVMRNILQRDLVRLLEKRNQIEAQKLSAQDVISDRVWMCHRHKCYAHDIFINYRYKTDAQLALNLAQELSLQTKEDGSHPTVFLDRHCLNEGEDWKEGFVHGLKNAKLIVLVLSKEGLEYGNRIRDAPIHEDNLLVEYETAVHMFKQKEVALLPLFVQQKVDDGNCVDVPGAPVLEHSEVGPAAYREFDPYQHIRDAGFPDRKHASPHTFGETVASTMKSILQIQGEQVVPDQSQFMNVVPKIMRTLEKTIKDRRFRNNVEHVDTPPGTLSSNHHQLAQSLLDEH